MLLMIRGRSQAYVVTRLTETCHRGGQLRGANEATFIVDIIDVLKQL